MLTNKVKAELILELYGSQSDNSMRNLVKLLDILISETRLDNDTAELDGVKRNQGEIKAYSTLKEFILRGLPSANRVA
jgi:hypothetical protein